MSFDINLQKQLPKHVAFIMDGNRRWAKKKKLQIIDGHKKGSEVVKNIVKKSLELKIKYLTFFSFSYLNVFFNYDDIIKSKDIFFSILDKEKINGMPDDVFNSAKKSFEDRFQKVDWKKYYNSLPFNESALALYNWAPVANELKSLDRKIVLNSMILKWDNIKEEFSKLIKI